MGTRLCAAIGSRSCSVSSHLMPEKAEDRAFSPCALCTFPLLIFLFVNMLRSCLIATRVFGSERSTGDLKQLGWPYRTSSASGKCFNSVQADSQYLTKLTPFTFARFLDTQDRSRSSSGRAIPQSWARSGVALLSLASIADAERSSAIVTTLNVYVARKVAMATNVSMFDTPAATTVRMH